MCTKQYPDPGTVLNNRYVVLEILNTGATAGVYYCEEVIGRQKVAVKRFSPDYLNNEIKKRAYAEPRLRINSPLVAKGYEVFEDSYLNLVMPFVQGKTLGEYLSEEGLLAEKTAIYLCLCMLSALNCLHNAQILSTDLKPDNTILTADGKVVLIDLGCCEQQNQPPTVSQGTEPYSAPELLQKATLTPACDLYSVGVMAIELLMDIDDFSLEAGSIEKNKAQGLPLDLRCIQQYPLELISIIERLTNPNPHERYQSTTETHHDLSAYYEQRFGIKTKPSNKISISFSTGNEFQIPKGSFVVGRNEIGSGSSFVSELHAEFFFDGESQVWVRDVQSRNGTTVNNVRVGNNWVAVKQNDVVCLADVQVNTRILS